MAWNHYRYRKEFRINKKTAECFRTNRPDYLAQKYQELSAKRPGIYSMQYREQRSDDYGIFHEWGRGGWKELTDSHLEYLLKELV